MMPPYFTVAATERALISLGGYLDPNHRPCSGGNADKG